MATIPTTSQPAALSELASHPVSVRVASVFEAAGIELYLVGGSVRDALTGTPDFSDLDFTTPARPPRIRELLERLGPIWDAGERFGTLGVQVDGQKVEVTTFRSDRYDPDSRKPEVCFGDEIADDLARRDFTINAMALALVDNGTYRVGDLVDPFDGAAALEARLLQTPRDPRATMSEDPLRMLRVVRFARAKGQPMDLDPALVAAVVETAPRLSIVAIERRVDELHKILAAGPKATRAALELARELEIAEYLTGALDTSPGALDYLDVVDSDGILAALVFGTGTDQGPTALRLLKLPSSESTFALQGARLATTLVSSELDLPAARLLVRSNPDAILDTAAALAHRQASAATLAALETARSDAIRVRGPLPIDGNDLLEKGLTGPAIGAALRAVTEGFLQNPGLSRRDALVLAGVPA